MGRLAQYKKNSDEKIDLNSGVSLATWCHVGLKVFSAAADWFGCLTRPVLRFDNEKKKIGLP